MGGGGGCGTPVAALCPSTAALCPSAASCFLVPGSGLWALGFGLSAIAVAAAASPSRNGFPHLGQFTADPAASAGVLMSPWQCGQAIFPGGGAVGIVPILTPPAHVFAQMTNDN